MAPAPIVMPVVFFFSFLRIDDLCCSVACMFVRVCRRVSIKSEHNMGTVYSDCMPYMPWSNGLFNKFQTYQHDGEHATGDKGDRAGKDMFDSDTAHSSSSSSDL